MSIDAKLDKIIENTHPKISVMQYQGSNIPSVARDYNAFGCPMLSWEQLSMNDLRQLSAEKSQLFNDIVTKSAKQMFRQNRNSECHEVEFIQSYSKDVLIPALKKHFISNVELESEHSYNYTLETIDKVVRVSGKTDHVLMITGTSLVALTWEDKGLKVSLDGQAVAQVKSQMMAEVSVFEIANPRLSPAEFVGILQNGRCWIFVFRRVIDGRLCWCYARLPEVFNSKEGVIQRHCEIVARFLEHAVCVADDIAASVTGSSKMVAIIPTKKSPAASLDDKSYNDDDHTISSKDKSEIDELEENNTKEDNTVNNDFSFFNSTLNTSALPIGDKLLEDQIFTKVDDRLNFVMPLTRLNVHHHNAKYIHSF